MTRIALRPLAAAFALIPCLALALWPIPARAQADSDVPALTRLVIQGDAVRAATDPDSAGIALWVTYDRKTRRWSPPASGPAPVQSHVDSLAGVRVFEGGLFDKFRGSAIALGDGYTLTRGDSGFALLREDGTNLGWPAVTEKDVNAWAGKVRQGLPRDYPEERVRELLDHGRLRNVPGPTMRSRNVRWFGLQGGFTGGEGQLGGLVSYDTDKGQYGVHRHFLLVDASVTRIFAREHEVWIGTARFGERALEGISGLILFRPERNEWRQFSRRNSRIAGDLVWDIAEDDGGLWVTTDRGVSRYGFESKNWTSWYWRRAPDGSGYTLSSKPPGDLAEELVR